MDAMTRFLTRLLFPSRATITSLRLCTQLNFSLFLVGEPTPLPKMHLTLGASFLERWSCLFSAINLAFHHPDMVMVVRKRVEGAKWGKPASEKQRARRRQLTDYGSLFLYIRLQNLVFLPCRSSLRRKYLRPLSDGHCSMSVSLKCFLRPPSFHD